MNTTFLRAIPGQWTLVAIATGGWGPGRCLPLPALGDTLRPPPPPCLRPPPRGAGAVMAIPGGKPCPRDCTQRGIQQSRNFPVSCTPPSCEAIIVRSCTRQNLQNKMTRSNSISSPRSHAKTVRGGADQIPITARPSRRFALRRPSIFSSSGHAVRRTSREPAGYGRAGESEHPGARGDTVSRGSSGSCGGWPLLPPREIRE